MIYISGNIYYITQLKGFTSIPPIETTCKINFHACTDTGIPLNNNYTTEHIIWSYIMFFNSMNILQLKNLTRQKQDNTSGCKNNAFLLIAYLNDKF